MNAHRSAWIVLFALLAAGRLFAQDVRQGQARETFALTGLGIVGRPIAGETLCEPNEGGRRDVQLLDSIGGQAVARLEWRIESYSCAAFFVRAGTSRRLYSHDASDYPEIEYESLGLVYYEARDGFARVFAATAPPGLWVRIADVPGERLRTWAQIVTEAPRLYRGYDGLALHEQPGEDSRVLVTLRERKLNDARVHQLTPTGELSGDFGRFEAVEFDRDFHAAPTQDASPTGNRWKGWLRVVNADGAPQFWFFTRD